MERNKKIRIKLATNLSDHLFDRYRHMIIAKNLEMWAFQKPVTTSILKRAGVLTVFERKDTLKNTNRATQVDIAGHQEWHPC